MTILETEYDDLKDRIIELEEECRLYKALHKEACNEVNLVYQSLQRLEKENERIRKICYSCEYCGYEPKLD